MAERQADISVEIILEEAYGVLSEMAKVIGIQVVPFTVGTVGQVRAIDELLIGLREKSWDSLSIRDGAGETITRAYGGCDAFSRV